METTIRISSDVKKASAEQVDRLLVEITELALYEYRRGYRDGRKDAETTSTKGHNHEQI